DPRARRPLHPPRRPRAELQHDDDADDWQLARRPVLGDGRRRGRALRPAARRRERGGAADAERDRIGQQGAGVHQESEVGRSGQPADGVRPPRLQVVRPAREGDQTHRRHRLHRHRQEPAARDRAGARTHRAAGRLLHHPQALPQRRLLLRLDLSGDGLPGGDVPGALRHPAHRRLDRAVGRDAARPRTEDRAPAADLYRTGPARLRGARKTGLNGSKPAVVQRLASAPFSATGNDAAPNLAERCTKPLVWVSLAGALVVATWGAAYTFPLLRIIVPAATVAAWLLARSKPVVAVQALLAAFYLVPAAFMLSVVFVPAGCWVVWMAPLAAAMLASTPASRWTMPDLVKVPLACWAMVVALTWPIVLVREADFVLARIHPNSVWWVATVAAATILGILWVDSLFASFPAERADDGSYEADVAVPMAAGWALSSFLAIYQLFGDINFLNRGLWGYMQRARGTFADANPFGVLSAIWGPLMFALAIERWRGWRRYLGAAALPLSWLAVWASGSRSSLPITALALAFIVGHYLRPGKSRRGVRAAAVAAALVVTVAAGAIASRGSGVESPFKRMAASFGPRLSLEWLAETAARLEARDGYGTIASFVIRQFPLVGTGVGTFHDLVPMYARMLFHGPLQPDNAQNWFRHQLVEFGLLGSLGWIAWVGVLLWALAFGRTASRALTAGVLRGVLVGFGLISLEGMPGQDVTVVITFWVLAFWYLLLLDSKTTTLARRIPAAAWVVVWAIAL